MLATREALFALRAAVGARSASTTAAKVILKQDVPLVGLAGDAVDVSRGFARNFLIPQRLATPTARKDGKGVTEEATVAPQREVVLSEADEAREAVRLLTATPLIIRRPVSRKSQKIVPISAKEILQFIREKKKVELPAESLLLSQPLPALGEYSLPLRLDGSVLEGNFVLAVRVLKKV